jgi:hypothetical protein
MHNVACLLSCVLYKRAVPAECLPAYSGKQERVCRTLASGELTDRSPAMLVFFNVFDAAVLDGQGSGVRFGSQGRS